MSGAFGVMIDEARIDHAAGHLVDCAEAFGVAAGDRMAIYAGNQPEFLVARRAAAAIGAIAVPINPRLAPPEVAFVLASSQPAAIACAIELAPRLPATTAPVIAVDAGWSSQISGRARRALDASADAIGATLLYTSGTTGRPKGCLRPAEAEAARARELVASYSITAADVHLVACPLAHSAPGIFTRAARSVGARTVVMPRFAPEHMLAAVEAHRASLCFLVPTQIERLLALDPARRAAFDVSSLRAVVVAGAPFPPARKRAAIEWLGEHRLWEFYGSTETGTIAVIGPGEHLAREGSVGRPPAGVTVEIRDDAGARLPAGATGEIHVRSPAAMSGYLDGGAPGSGFLSVGDLGRVDADGYVTLIDRKHDTIISGGVNVHPAEVERALCEHPAVEAAVVFGVADPEWGEIVAAAVASTASIAELSAFLRERIAGFKLPRAYAFVPAAEMPIGSTGKPLRRVARAQLTDRLIPAPRSG